MRALRPDETFDPALLPSPDAALAAYAAALPLQSPASERVPLAAAAGRVLATAARADADYPAADRSTMDGYAVCAADGAAPRTIAGDVRMGSAPASLVPGTAQRIPTGGALPAGADAVIPVEDADADGDRLAPHEAPTPGQYVTPRGSDMRAGATVLAAGRRIGPAEIGVLATLGAAEVVVIRRPRVAVLSTGDELVAVGAAPELGQIRDSNRWAIAAAFAAAGFDLVHVPAARDDLAELRARLRSAADAADAVVLTGGSSVGTRDLTPEAIEALGGRVVIHGLRVKPGKPTVLGALGAQPVIGLPGNPASALTIAVAIAIPALRALTGESPVPPAPHIRAQAGAAFTGRPGWTWYVPATLAAGPGGWIATPLALHSAHVSLLARSDGYVTVAGDPAEIASNAPVDVVPWPRNATFTGTVVAP